MIISNIFWSQLWGKILFSRRYMWKVSLGLNELRKIIFSSLLKGMLSLTFSFAKTFELYVVGCWLTVGNDQLKNLWYFGQQWPYWWTVKQKTKPFHLFCFNCMHLSSSYLNMWAASHKLPSLLFYSSKYSVNHQKRWCWFFLFCFSIHHIHWPRLL